MTNIYCNNDKCEFYNKLDNPVPANFDSLSYVPFIGDKYTGKCISNCLSFIRFNHQTLNVDMELATCLCNDVDKNNCGELTCFVEDCSWNTRAHCNRPLIFVSSDFTTGKIVCKSFANKKFKGHRDWFSLLTADGTARGGHIDDDYARKLDADARKFKSFSNGHREAKPRTPKKGR